MSDDSQPDLPSWLQSWPPPQGLEKAPQKFMADSTGALTISKLPATAYWRFYSDALK